MPEESQEMTDAQQTLDSEVDESASEAGESVAATEESGADTPAWLDDHEATVGQAIDRLEALAAEVAKVKEERDRLRDDLGTSQRQVEDLHQKIAALQDAAAEGASGASQEVATSEEASDWQQERAEIRQRVESLTETLETLLD